MMAAECEDRGGPIDEASMQQIAEVVSGLVLEALVAETAFVAEDEGAVTKNMGEVAEVAEDEGTGTKNEGTATQHEGSEATPPPAKKARLLEGLKHEGSESVVEAAVEAVCEPESEPAPEASAEATQIETYLETLVGDTLGTCSLCGGCVDESGGCVGGLFLSQPDANEASEAASDAASEAAVEAEDRHASEQVLEPLSEAGPEAAMVIQHLMESTMEAMSASGGGAWWGCAVGASG